MTNPINVELNAVNLFGLEILIAILFIGCIGGMAFLTTLTLPLFFDETEDASLSKPKSWGASQVIVFFMLVCMWGWGIINLYFATIRLWSTYG